MAASRSPKRWVIETLHRLAPDHDPLAVLSRLEVHEHTVQLALNVAALSPKARGLPVTIDRVRRALVEDEQIQVEGERLWVHIPRRLKLRGGKAWLSGEAPKRSRMSQALIKALRRSHHLGPAGPMRTACCSRRRHRPTNATLSASLSWLPICRRPSSMDVRTPGSVSRICAAQIFPCAGTTRDAPSGFENRP